MQIIVILLLAIALALLVLGLIGSTPALVVASILASLVAMATIVRVRRRRVEAVRSAPPATAGPSVAELAAAVAASRHAAANADQHAVTVGELVAAEAAPAAAHPAPAAVNPAPASVAEPASVDQALPVTAEQSLAAEPVSVAEPASADDEADPPAADTQAPLARHGQSLVWVIDGRPRYHLVSCHFLTGRPGEPIPLSQAVEDGFSPCGRCDPDNLIGQSTEDR